MMRYIQLSQRIKVIIKTKSKNTGIMSSKPCILEMIKCEELDWEQRPCDKKEFSDRSEKSVGKEGAF